MSFFDWSDDSAPATMPDAMHDAFAVVAKRSEFFEIFSRGLRWIRDDALPSVMGTDCVDTVYYNGAMIEADAAKWNPEALSTAIAHECMHILRDDGSYRDTYGNPQYANIAMDSIINRDLCGDVGSYRKRGATWPRPLTPHDPTQSVPQGECTMEAASDFETTISAYRKVEKLFDAAKKKQQPTPQGDGDILADKHAQRTQELGGDKPSRDKVESLARMSYEQAKASAEAQAASGQTPNNGMVRNDSKDAAEGYGLQEGGVQREIERLGVVSVTRPVVRIARVAGAQVRGMLRSKSSRVRSSMTPSAMSAAHGRILPGPRRKNEYNIAIAIDASGSISHERLQLFTESARQWVTQFQSRGKDVQVCFFDTGIRKRGTMRDFRDANNVPNSGGGTCFLPLFAQWLPSIPKPTHLIIFTDTQGTWPTEAPQGVRVIGIIPNSYKSSSYAPAWCEPVYAEM